jgi:hypothetical protein
MDFIERRSLYDRFAGKSVAIVGSGPSVLDNDPGFIDSHEVVVRVNNYRILPQTGYRTDVFYSFFGQSIRKGVRDLINDGVNLCMCKCPNDQFMKSKWHEQRKKTTGTDFRYIYNERERWWFCDTYVPTVDEFLEKFNLLGGHIPTTGFAAILDIISFKPDIVYLTGFDFFKSGIHNVDELWIEKNNDDPIRHEPERELQWLRDNMESLPLSFDDKLIRIL